MVTRIVRVNGRLAIELDEESQQALGVDEGSEVVVSVSAGELRITSSLDATAKRILQRHADTFGKLAK